jgi:hypothetical protein
MNLMIDRYENDPEYHQLVDECFRLRKLIENEQNPSEKMRHTIQLHEYSDFSFYHLLAASSGEGSNKQLQAVVQLDGEQPVISFEVLVHRKIILTSKSLAEAVAAYNNER